MAKFTKRVFVRNARLSFPSLDEPRETMAGSGQVKYMATFIMDVDNPSVKAIKDAITEVAVAEFGQQKGQKLAKDREKTPLKWGNERETIPAGYEDNWYISAKSTMKPELRDANPRNIIVDQKTILEKFVPGYRVNGYIDLYPYTVKNQAGVTMKYGVAAGLVSVQFAGYDEPFVGPSKTKDEDYPDLSSEVEENKEYAVAEEDIPF